MMGEPGGALAPVLIVGATGGVGQALARRLHAAGHPLHLVARRPEPLAALAQELGCPFTVADVLDAAAMARAVTEAGPALKGLVVAVGSIVLKPFKRTTTQDFLDAFLLNVAAPADLMRLAEPALKAGSGSVVVFSSVAAGTGFANHAAIGAAKAALEGLVHSLAAEWAPAIRINAVAPSLTQTPLAQMLTSNPATATAIAAQHPLGRLGLPEDIAQAAEFCLTNTWMTGQVVRVDGGRSVVAGK